MLQNVIWLALGVLIGLLASRLWRAQQSRQLQSSTVPVGGAVSWSLLSRLHPNDALIWVKRGGTIVQLNAKASLWLGMNAEPGQSLGRFFSAATESELNHFWQKAASSAECFISRVRLQEAGFTAIDVDVLVASMSEGDADYLVKLSHYSVGQSAEGRDTVLDSIKENLLNSSISAIVAVDENDRIVEFNPCAEQLFGYVRQQILGNTMADLIIPEAFRAMHYAGMRRFISEGRTTIMNKRVEVAAINAQGQQFPIEIEVSPCRQDGGWLFIAVIQDISERKRSAAITEQALADAQTANRQKSRFLTSVSHEIRTPLHEILGLIECLQHTALNDQQLHYIHLAQTAGDNLLNMVNDVLDMGSIEAGKREVHASLFNPRKLLEEHLEIYRHRIAEQGLALYLIVAPDAPNRVLSDITIVRQILTNLLSNACQYTEIGSITVRSWFESSHANQGFWCCRISDTGPGFTEEQQAQLFHEFTRFQQHQTKGTGVGLMICRQLTHLLGGQLSVESKSGQGAAFTLQLPATARHPRRQFKWLQALPVYLWSADDSWLACFRHQLHALGVQQIRQISEPQLSELPAQSIVIADERIAVAPERFAQWSHLRFISGGSEQRSCWSRCPQHFAFVAQPFRQQDLVFALRAASRARHWISQGAKHRPPTLVLMPPASQQAFHVLLADDSEVNRLTIKTFLGLEGIKVTEATDGAEAIEQVKQNTFDLILMDLRMPGIGGIEATKFIRQHQLADLTPIIALTAHVQEEEKQRCLQSGMQDFLTKPIGKAMLLKRVMHWLKPTEVPTACAEQSNLATAPADFLMYPLVDELQLKQFRAELKEENYQRLNTIFLAESTRQVNDILQFLQQQEYERLEILAHSLKSSALTFGAVRLSHIAKMTELACRQQELDAIPGHCQALAEVNQLTHEAFSRR